MHETTKEILKGLSPQQIAEIKKNTAKLFLRGSLEDGVLPNPPGVDNELHAKFMKFMTTVRTNEDIRKQMEEFFEENNIPNFIRMAYQNLWNNELRKK